MEWTLPFHTFHIEETNKLISKHHLLKVKLYTKVFLLFIKNLPLIYLIDFSTNLIENTRP